MFNEKSFNIGFDFKLYAKDTFCNSMFPLKLKSDRFNFSDFKRSNSFKEVRLSFINAQSGNNLYILDNDVNVDTNRSW